ncbi:hypothetical protein F5Y06DRAFT_261199 [Hypoxylon sp. FL0890]|nr:hypothetical protein F5Y06DRAFT_261199 [Hypoxylon sp. FL0890]
MALRSNMVKSSTYLVAFIIVYASGNPFYPIFGNRLPCVTLGPVTVISSCVAFQSCPREFPIHHHFSVGLLMTSFI